MIAALLSCFSFVRSFCDFMFSGFGVWELVYNFFLNNQIQTNQATDWGLQLTSAKFSQKEGVAILWRCFGSPLEQVKTAATFNPFLKDPEEKAVGWRTVTLPWCAESPAASEVFFFFCVCVVAHIEGGFGCSHRGRSKERAAEFTLAALMRRAAPAAVWSPSISSRQHQWMEARLILVTFLFGGSESSAFSYVFLACLFFGGEAAEAAARRIQTNRTRGAQPLAVAPKTGNMFTASFPFSQRQHKSSVLKYCNIINISWKMILAMSAHWTRCWHYWECILVQSLLPRNIAALPFFFSS